MCSRKHEGNFWLQEQELVCFSVFGSMTWKKIKKKTVWTNQKQYEGCEICYTNNGASAVQAVRAVSNSACGVHERQHILSQLTKFMSLRYMCVNAQMQNTSLSLHGMSHFGTKSMLNLQNHSRTFHNIDATGGKRSTWRCLSLSCLIRNLTTSCFLKEFKEFHLVMAFFFFHLYSSFFLGTCYFLPV